MSISDTGNPVSTIVATFVAMARLVRASRLSLSLPQTLASEGFAFKISPAGSDDMNLHYNAITYERRKLKVRREPQPVAPTTSSASYRSLPGDMTASAVPPAADTSSPARQPDASPDISPLAPAQHVPAVSGSAPARKLSFACSLSAEKYGPSLCIGWAEVQGSQLAFHATEMEAPERAKLISGGEYYFASLDNSCLCKAWFREAQGASFAFSPVCELRPRKPLQKDSPLLKIRDSSGGIREDIREALRLHGVDAFGWEVSSKKLRVFIHGTSKEEQEAVKEVTLFPHSVPSDVPVADGFL